MKINKTLISLSLLGSSLIATVASAQYYDPNQYYNNNNSYQNNYQQQPYGVTSFGGSGSNYYVDQNPNYNYNYNNNNYSDYNYNNNGYNNNYNYDYTNYSYQILTPVTTAATYVNSTSGTINGYVILSNSGYGTAWFQYGTSYSNLNLSSSPAPIYQTTNMNAHLTNLSCSTTYYFRAVTSSQNDIQYGDTLSFTTSPCAYNYNSYYSNYTQQNYSYSHQSVKTNCTKRKYRK